MPARQPKWAWGCVVVICLCEGTGGKAVGETGWLVVRRKLRLYRMLWVVMVFAWMSFQLVFVAVV